MATVAKCSIGLNDGDKQALKDIISELSLERGEKTPSTKTKNDGVRELVDGIYQERLTLAKRVSEQGGHIAPLLGTNKVAASVAPDADSPSTSVPAYTFTAKAQAAVLRFAKPLIKLLGRRFRIKVKFLSYDEALTLAKKVDDKVMHETIRNGASGGYAMGVEGEYYIYVKPGLSAPVRAFTLMHEIGHVIKWEHFDGASNEQLDAVMEEFQKWRVRKGNDAVTLEEMIHSRKPYEAAREWLRAINLHTTNQVGDLGKVAPEYKKYILEFDEYIADFTGKYLLRELRPRSVVGRFFYDLSRALIRVFGKDQVGRYLDNIQGKTGLRSVHNARFFKKMEGELNNVVNDKHIASAVKAAKVIIQDKDKRLRNSTNPAVRKLADLMFKARGDNRIDRSYWSAKNRALGRFDSKLNEIMKGVNPDEIDGIMKALYSGKPSINKVVIGLRSLLSDIADYTELGTNTVINRRENYFPQIVNLDWLSQHEFSFKEMMGSSKYKKRLESIRGEWGLPKGTDMAQALYDHLINNGGIDDLNLPAQQRPGNRFVNKRLMTFLSGDDVNTWTTKYLEKSPVDAMSSYITQTVKRTEYERRFGKLTDEQADSLLQKLLAQYEKANKGQEISYYELSHIERQVADTTKFSLLRDEARETGATEEEIRLMENTLSAEMGTYGFHTADWLHKNFGLALPPLYSPINSTLQTAQTTLMAMSNVMILGLSTITSLADPIGMAVRTGDVGVAFSAMKGTIQDIITKNPSEARQLAEEIGQITDLAIKEALQHEYSSTYMPRNIRRMSDAYFRLIGLDQWTRTTRIMATKAAMLSIVKNKGKRFNKELGLLDGDISGDGDLGLLAYDQLKTATKAQKARDNRVRAAVSQFVDESILRPNPSQRPLWANNPHFALLFHLKSFMYSFHKTIISPSLREMTLHNNYKPIMAVAAYVPMMVAVGLFKDLLKGRPDNPYKSDWGVMDYVSDGAQKGGLTGVFQPIFDVYRERSFGDSGIGAFLSPGLDVEGTFGYLPVPARYWFADPVGG